MRRKNLLKELGIQKQADTSCNALDIDTEMSTKIHQNDFWEPTSGLIS